jgi:hypothetical protein
MHRCGTSVAARALDAAGVSFGRPDQLMPPGPDNKAGYWENLPIKALDDDLLAHLGGSWDRPPVLEPAWEEHPALDEFRARAADVLDAAFDAPTSSSGPIGWKDPRLSLLLPFWRTVGPVDGTVIVVRHPTEVAASLAERNQMDPITAHLLWLRYVLAAVDNDDNHLIVDHHALLEQPAEALAAMAAHFGLSEPDDATIATVLDHLEPGLQHHRAEAASAEADPVNPVVALTRAVWNDGDLAVDALEPTTADAIRQGWLRPPTDTEELDRERARVVDLTELLRRRTRERMDERLEGLPSEQPS